MKQYLAIAFVLFGSCTGDTGDPGPQGEQGEQGPPGEPESTPISVASGGTGATTASGALDNLLPSQTGNADAVLTTNATTASWASVRSVLAAGDEAGLVVRGTYTTVPSSPPATGQGVRMMWYPQKGAFRAGYVVADGWDDAKVGPVSTAFGQNVIASGEVATAIGNQTTASGDSSTAAGYSTVASGVMSTTLGRQTTASGDYSTAAGALTVASNDASTALGYETTASGMFSLAAGLGATAGGDASTAIGSNTTANGNDSVALGLNASDNGHAGAFLFGDTSTSNVMNATANNQFSVRAAGGVRFFTNSLLTTGVTIAAGAGSWATVSDRNAKQDFEHVDGDVVVNKILGLDIQRWRYKAEVSRAFHIGPVAQDFYAAFGLGDSDKTIATVDIDGVNLLAIQTLARRSARAEQRVGELERQNAELLARLSAVEQAVRERACGHAVAAVQTRGKQAPER